MHTRVATGPCFEGLLVCFANKTSAIGSAGSGLRGTHLLMDSADGKLLLAHPSSEHMGPFDFNSNGPQ